MQAAGHTYPFDRIPKWFYELLQLVYSRLVAATGQPDENSLTDGQYIATIQCGGGLDW